jgi:predicted ATPase with chaperone activity
MLVEMAENRALALDAGELGAATTSSRDRARVAGLLKDRLELTGRDGAAIAVEQEVSIDERSSYELARRIAFALQLGRKRTKSAPKDEA